MSVWEGCGEAVGDALQSIGVQNPMHCRAPTACAGVGLGVSADQAFSLKLFKMLAHRSIGDIAHPSHFWGGRGVDHLQVLDNALFGVPGCHIGQDI